MLKLTAESINGKGYVLEKKQSGNSQRRENKLLQFHILTINERYISETCRKHLFYDLIKS